ncbi:hemicentin-1-like [Stylophora pistillata]|nr:hemicentin-1-like [Stylophora pistillata]XP_022805351.1 hemicentin-1-like [Stylophora pistillata]
MTSSREGETTSAKETVTSSVPTKSHSLTTPLTLPGVPIKVSSKSISETELEVSWIPPQEGSANILFYRVKFIDVSGGGLTRIFQVPGDVQSVKVGSLDGETEYQFTVSAGNQHGIGPFSEERSGRTKAKIARIEPTEDAEVQSTSQEEPVVKLSHRTDFVVAGMDKTTRAICFVSGQEFIGWFKSTGEQVLGTSPSHRMYVEDEDDGYSLVIRRLMRSDGGEYVCRGTKTSATYSLYVEFSVEDPPATQNLWLNQDGEIFVGVKIGYPAPEYLWKKDGVKLDANSGRFRLLPDGTIKISKVSAEDAGDYKVRISQLNRRRETTETIKVKIFDPPKIDNTKPAIRNLTFSYPTTLECVVSGIPKPEVTWIGPNGETVTGSEQRISFQSDGSLKILQVNLFDFGKWTCEAINSVGRASRRIEVQAIYMPPEIHQLSNITAKEGDSKSLNCTASGFPLPEVIWLKDNIEYPGQMKKPGESVLNMEDLGLDDISKFVCQASNAATNEEGEVIVKEVAIDLFVMVEPRPYDSNLVKEPIYSELGSPDPVRLACAFTGYPPPQVWITKDGNVVINGVESVWIDKVTDSLDDYGLYHCVAENVVSLSKLNYTFEVRRSEAPKFTLEPKLPSGNLTAGFPVTMTWNVSGIPKPEVRWKSPSDGYVTLDNPRFLLNQRELTIKTLEEKDAGMWTIEATNSLKTTKAQVEFGTVIVRPQINPIPDVVAHEGKSVTLTCTASGVPIPDVKWISEGKDFFDEQRSPGKSEITLLNLGLEDNSLFICEAKNGAQDDKGKELVSVQSMKLIVKVEPKPADSTHRAKPVLSYIGNPEHSVFNCEFSGYPPPDVRIIKDGQVLAYSKDSLSYSVSVDSVDDFGEYVCMAENEVGKSKQNYTFEIQSSAAPSSPRDLNGEPTCDSIILSWNHPEESGGFPVINYVITYSNNTMVISSDMTDFVIDNLEHGKTYKIAIQARTEAGIGKEASLKVKTTQFCKVSSCVNIIEDGDLFTLNASRGLWPRDGFCRGLSAHRASAPDMYRLSADYYIPGTKDSMMVTYVGVFFNAQNEDNFDFIFFRVGASDNRCFQTGEIQRRRLNWYGSQVGSCPHGPPRNARWIHITLEVRKSEVSVFLEGVHVTSFRGHFPPKGAGGVLLANRQGSIIQFKNFIINDIPSLPFETKSCATVQDNTKFYSMISQGDFWSQGFCRALLKEVNLAETSTYQVSVDLFSDLGWSGDRVAYLGIIFNARDINNADFIYFRPYWKDHCYQTGYIMGGRQKREGAKTGPCSCTVTGGKWFNVRLEIRGNIVSVFMNGVAAATFKSHYPSTNKGSGVLVTGGCRKSIRFRNFTVKSLPLLPFTSKNCQSARDTGSYFTLIAYTGIEDTTQPGVCRAVYPKSVLGTSYVISVSFYVQGSLLGGKYGVMFNAKNADSFEFVYFRPYNRDDCVQIGYLQGTKVNEGDRRERKSLTCTYGFMRGGSWYDVRLKVSRSEVKVFIDDVEVAAFKSRFPTIGRGGVMVASGYKRKISFKNFRIL